MFNIELKPWQSEFILNPARFKVACCGRRSGKSVTDIVIAYLQALNYPGSVIWLIAPTHEQAKMLFWSWLVEGIRLGDQILPPLFDEKLIAHRDNSPGRWHVKLINGSEIHIKGSSNADALLGASLDLLILDEYQSQNPEVWWKLLPMLADRKGKAVITGTPRGFNHFHDLWINGSVRNPDKLDNWHSVQIQTAMAGTIAPEEIEEARCSLTEREFNQEFMASFESMDDLVYGNYFDVIENATTLTVQDFHPSFPLHVGVDFNKRIMATTISIFPGDSNAFCVDEVENCYNTEELIKVLKARYGDRKLIIHPDVSGDKGTGITDFSLFAMAGYEVLRPNPNKQNNPRVWDRVNTVNAMLRNGAGQRRLKINTAKCTSLVKCLQQQTVVNGEPLKAKDLDHLPDALGYSLYRYFAPKSSQHTGTYSYS